MNKHGWTYKKLGEVATIISGSTPKTNIPEYWDGAYYWVTPAELGKSVYIGETERTITNDAVSNTNLTLLPVGTVLLSSRAPIGKIAITTAPMYCNQGFKNIVCSEELNNKFTYYFIGHIVPYLQSLGRGATFKEISKTIVENVKLPVPSMEEQEAIVAELDEINEAIAALQQQVTDLDTLALSTFYDMFGDPETNPKGWDVKKIGDICTLKSGDSSANNSKEGNLPYVKVADMNLAENADYILTSSKFVDREQNQRGVFPIGTIIFPKRGGAILTNKKRMTKVEVCCDLNVMGVIPSEVIDNIYLYQWFKIFDLSKVTSGSTVLQLNNCDIAPLKISLPPLALQQEFAAKVEAMESAKAEINAQIAEMQTLLASRMDYYFD